MVRPKRPYFHQIRAIYPPQQTKTKNKNKSSSSVNIPPPDQNVNSPSSVNVPPLDQNVKSLNKNTNSPPSHDKKKHQAIQKKQKTKLILKIYGKHQATGLAPTLRYILIRHFLWVVYCGYTSRRGCY